MIATIFLACAVWTFVRTNRITGDAGAQLAWRWTQTAGGAAGSKRRGTCRRSHLSAPYFDAADSGRLPHSRLQRR